MYIQFSSRQVSKQKQTVILTMCARYKHFIRAKIKIQTNKQTNKFSKVTWRIQMQTHKEEFAWTYERRRGECVWERASECVKSCAPGGVRSSFEDHGEGGPDVLRSRRGAEGEHVCPFENRESSKPHGPRLPQVGRPPIHSVRGNLLSRPASSIALSSARLPFSFTSLLSLLAL